MKVKRIAFVALLLLFAAKLAAAAVVKSESVLIELEDWEARWQVSITYQSPVKRSDFFIFSFVRNVSVRANEVPIECELSRTEAGTLIDCKGLENVTRITYAFVSPDLITRIGALKRFAYEFAIVDLIEELDFTIALPVGHIISSAEEARISPITPANYTVGSDGRRILIRWHFERPRLGSAIRLSVVYKPAIASLFLRESSALILLAFAVVLAFFALAHLKKRARAKVILAVLNEEERKIVEFLLRQRNKEATQKRIARELDLSKSKASRLLRGLEQRGVVKLTRSGRTNRVKLVLR